MNNQDLINQRVELLISNSNKNAKKKINSLQNDINIKLQDIKEKLNL